MQGKYKENGKRGMKMGRKMEYEKENIKKNEKEKCEIGRKMARKS